MSKPSAAPKSSRSKTRAAAPKRDGAAAAKPGRSMPKEAAVGSRRVRRPTIYDLARLADVSPGTVSRVLNNRDRVNPETRDRILRAAKELDLKPRASVRFREVAILSEPSFSDRVEGYAATLTAHLSFAFSRRNIGVLLPLNPFEELPGMFLDGIIAVTEDRALKALVAELETRMPVVHMDKFPLNPAENIVCSDHFGAGYLAAKYFIERGRRKLGFLGGDYPAVAERLKGFKQALTEASLPIDDRCTAPFGPGINHASVVTRIVRAGADAIYAPGSSFQAMECLHILTYVMGLKVPHDISLIGGENEGVSTLLNPPLTTIEEPLREMAEQAAAMFDRLTSGGKLAERNITLPVRLIERNSVA